jgi:hypothetical protein
LRIISQLASIRYSFTSSGQMRIEDKDDLRARGEWSPDLADATMLAFAKRPERGYKVWAGTWPGEVRSPEVAY